MVRRYTSFSLAKVAVCFFQNLADRHMADRFDVLECHHLVGQQSQGPAAIAFRRIAAGQHRQVGFGLTCERR